MITQGQYAPDFTLRGVIDGEFETFELSEYTNRGTVLVAFYVFDFAPVCTEEMCSLRDAESIAFTNDTAVFGISTDGIYSHQRFAEEYDIDFPLLSDTSGQVAEAFDVLYDAQGCEDVAQRSLFAIDDQQVIQYAWSTDDEWEDPDYDELRRALAPL